MGKMGVLNPGDGLSGALSTQNTGLLLQIEGVTEFVTVGDREGVMGWDGNGQQERKRCRIRNPKCIGYIEVTGSCTRQQTKLEHISADKVHEVTSSDMDRPK